MNSEKGLRGTPCGEPAEATRGGIEQEFFSGDVTGHDSRARIARADYWFKGKTQRSMRNRLIRVRVPGAALSRRNRLEGTRQLIAALLAFERVDLGSVWHLKLDVIAAHISFDRRVAEARSMDHQVAMQETVRLRAQPQFHLLRSAASQSLDLSVRNGRPGQGRGWRAGRRRGPKSTAARRRRRIRGRIR